MLKNEKSANRNDHQNRKNEVFCNKTRKTDLKNSQNYKNKTTTLVYFIILEYNERMDFPSMSFFVNFYNYYFILLSRAKRKKNKPINNELDPMSPPVWTSPSRFSAFFLFEGPAYIVSILILLPRSKFTDRYPSSYSNKKLQGKQVCNSFEPHWVRLIK